MADYSAAQMEESLAEEVVVPQAAPKPWKRIGLVAAVLGCAGAVVGLTRPQKLTQMQQMLQTAQMSHSFMQAFVERALQDGAEKSMTVDMGLTFAEAGVEPTAMTIEAYLRPAEEPANTPEPHVVIAFNAKADQAEALKDQIQKVLDELKEMMELPADLVALTADEEKVYITITPPPMGMSEEDEEGVEQGMEAKPSFKFSLGTGRDFEQMVAHPGACPVTLPGGFKISASTQIAEALFETMEDVAAKAGNRGHVFHIRQAKKMFGMVEKPLESISSLASHSAIRYNKEALEASPACDATDGEWKMMNQKFQKFKDDVPEMVPKKISEALSGLAEHADSFAYIRFASFLPRDYEVHVDFTNFKITPVIKGLLQKPEPAEAADPDAGPAEDEEAAGPAEAPVGAEAADPDAGPAEE